MNKKIGILGAGTWGIALARLLANSDNDVTVWSHNKKAIADLKKTSRHPRFLDVLLPESIKYTSLIKEICLDKDIIVFAVPSIYVREVAKKTKDYINNKQIIVDVAKGIETNTLMMLSEVIKDELGDDIKIVALSGPTHAEEVIKDLPTTIVASCEDLEVAKYVQEVFASSFFRVYTNTDIKGTEICGALKNIMALAAGISDGLGYGDNAKAAIITRGLQEMKRLGTKIGCLDSTFSGLTGVGDLIVTCTSRHSRNNRCGYLIGQGKKVDEAIKEIGMVVEGVNALPAAIKLRDKYNVDMPIVSVLDEIINNGLDPKEAVNSLFKRELKSEAV